MVRRCMLTLLALLLVLPVLAVGEASPWQTDGQGTITAYTGPGGEVTIPDSIDGVAVIAIGNDVFNTRADITAVTFPQGLKRIGLNAFYMCDGLTALTLPDGLEVVDDYAFFASQGLTTVTVPASVVYIGSNAFASCGAMTSMTFVGEQPLMGPDAMAYNNAAITAGSAAVDHTAAESDLTFDAATGLITGYTGSKAYAVIPATIGGVAVKGIGARALFSNKTLVRLTLLEGLTVLEKEALAYGDLRRVDLPTTLTTIGDNALSGNRLIDLAVPAGVTSIGVEAFSGNPFRSASIGEGPAELPKGAFQYSPFLYDVSLPASLTNIGEGAFNACSGLGYLIFAGNTLPALGANAFAGCPIADVDIATDATRAQAEAAKAQLVAYGLPADSVTVWRANPPGEAPYPSNATFAFDAATGTVSNYQGDYTEMTMFWTHWDDASQSQQPIRALGEGIFEGSAITRFDVPHSETLATIGARAFKGSQLTSIYLFDSVTDIGDEAFANCLNLTEIVIPNSVKTIGAGAFSGSANLRSVVFKGGAPVIAADAFAGCTALATLELPAKAQPQGNLGANPAAIRVRAEATDEEVAALQTALALPWNVTLLRAGAPDPTVLRPDSEVANAETDFEFDASTGTITKYIGKTAQVVVPAAIGGVPVRSIGFTAFSDATVMSFLEGTAANTGLTRVVLPGTVTTIEDSAFLECRALTEIIGYGAMERIGNRAFENCTALTTAYFPNGIRALDLYAFHLCAALAKDPTDARTQDIPEGAFLGTGLAGELVLTAPAIGNSAYKDAKGITSIRVTPTVKTIAPAAFQGITGLTSITFERADKDILGAGNFQFTEDMTGFTLYLPQDATDQQVADFVSILNQNLLPGDTMVKRAGQ